jgi:cytoskeletal protein RodZ
MKVVTLVDGRNTLVEFSSIGVTYTFGRGGGSSSGTWLLNEGFVSNKSGRNITLATPVLFRISTATDTVNTYTVQVYQHQGNEVGMTLITSFSVTAAKVGDSGVISHALSEDKQIAVKVSSGSADNLNVSLYISGA